MIVTRSNRLSREATHGERRVFEAKSRRSPRGHPVPASCILRSLSSHNLLTISVSGSSFCRVRASLKERAMHPKLRITVLVAAVVGFLTPVAANRQSTEASHDVTF